MQNSSFDSLKEKPIKKEVKVLMALAFIQSIKDDLPKVSEDILDYSYENNI